MNQPATNLQDFLGALLRGAAKIVGCNSTNLILVNENTQEVRVHVGILSDATPALHDIESVIGASFSSITLPIKKAEDSLAYQAWRGRAVYETSSLSELLGSVFPAEVSEELGRLVGERRFVCVPAMYGGRNYGVLIFDKNDPRPFTRQQHEVLLRHARSIAEIVENNFVGQGQTLFSHAATGGPEFLVIDADGQVLGYGPDTSSTIQGLLAAPERLAALRERVRTFLQAPGAAAASEAIDLPADGVAGGLRLMPSRLTMDGRSCALCRVQWASHKQDASLDTYLMKLTLGDPAPTIFVDTALRVTSCNEATERLFGWSSGELLGRPIGDLFRSPDEIDEILGRHTADPQNPYAEESTTARTRAGTLFPALVKSLLLADDHGQVLGTLVLVREITDDETDADAETDRARLRERLVTMGEMAAQLAHEIRNPLIAIGATLESMSNDDLAGEQRGLVDAAIREIARLDLILKGYMAGRLQDLRLRDVRLLRVVDDARRVLDGAHRLQGKAIAVSVDPALVVRADHAALKHVLFNLLLNALEASPPQGTVTLRATPGERETTIAVEDEGPGLQAAPADCFRPFFTTKKNGTGLGLSVCQKIIRAHGGVVELRNREGGGCQARVVLPGTGRA